MDRSCTENEVLWFHQHTNHWAYILCFCSLAAREKWSSYCPGELNSVAGHVTYMELRHMVSTILWTVIVLFPQSTLQIQLQMCLLCLRNMQNCMTQIRYNLARYHYASLITLYGLIIRTYLNSFSLSSLSPLSPLSLSPLSSLLSPLSSLSSLSLLSLLSPPLSLCADPDRKRKHRLHHRITSQ